MANYIPIPHYRIRSASIGIGIIVWPTLHELCSRCRHRNCATMHMEHTHTRKAAKLARSAICCLFVGYNGVFTVFVCTVNNSRDGQIYLLISSRTTRSNSFYFFPFVTAQVATAFVWRYRRCTHQRNDNTVQSDDRMFRPFTVLALRIRRCVSVFVSCTDCDSRLCAL